MPLWRPLSPTAGSCGPRRPTPAGGLWMDATDVTFPSWPRPPRAGSDPVQTRRRSALAVARVEPSGAKANGHHALPCPVNGSPTGSPCGSESRTVQVPRPPRRSANRPAENATAKDHVSWPRTARPPGRRADPTAGTVRSAPAEAISEPSGENATAKTASSWPANGRPTGSPRASQRRIVRSAPAEAVSRPSGSRRRP